MKIVTPEEAVSVIGSRQQIYLHCAAATPSVLLDALVARAVAEDLTDISVVHLHIEGPGPHHKHGPLKVAVEVKVPGPNIRVNRQADEDLFLAIREAFDAAGRRLEDSVRRRRGFVKAHEE